MATEIDEDVQPMLIDVDHPQAKPLKKLAAQYKKAQAERMDALAKEIEFKGQIAAMAKEMGAKPNADGVIAIKIRDLTVKVIHRDELVKVKFDDESSQGDGPDEQIQAEGAEQASRRRRASKITSKS